MDFLKRFTPSQVSDEQERLRIGRALAILFAALVVAGFCFSFFVFKSSAGSRDFDYFARFAAKAYAPAAEQYFPIHPSGTDFIFNGPDGAVDFHKDIHFEPYKYLQALLYFLFQSPLVLFFLQSLLILSPLLYGAWLLRKRNAVMHPNLLGATLLVYALFPTTLTMVSDALRPFDLLFPFFILLMISLVYRRSLFEQLVFLSLLLLVREEALILAFIALGYVFLREVRERESHERSAILSVPVVAAIAAVSAYFWWIRDAYALRDFSHFSGKAQRLIDFVSQHSLVSFAGFAVLVAAGFFLAWRFRKHLIRYAELIFFVLGSIFLVGASFGASFAPKIWPPNWLYEGRFSMILIMLFVAFIFVLAYALPQWRRLIEKCVWVLAVLMLALQFAAPNSVPENISFWVKQSVPARVVFNAHAQLPPETPVLVDESTLGVFYDFAHVQILVFGVPSPGGDIREYYPASASALGAALKSTTTTYAILSAESVEAAKVVAKAAGKSITALSANDSFGFYEIR